VLLLGSGFSPALGEVILLTDAAMLLIVVVAVFYDRIAGACAAVLHHASTIVACAIAHIGPRHR
jgi:hypothetical protein